jgi:hypothetical protein
MLEGKLREPPLVVAPIRRKEGESADPTASARLQMKANGVSKDRRGTGGPSDGTKALQPVYDRFGSFGSRSTDKHSQLPRTPPLPAIGDGMCSRFVFDLKFAVRVLLNVWIHRYPFLLNV